MDIRFNEKDRLFVIDTENTSYVIGILGQEGFLGHLYFGDKIEYEDAPYLYKFPQNLNVPEPLMRDRSSFLDF